MAIFGFKKRKDEKLEQAAEATKSVSKKKPSRAKAKTAMVKDTNAKDAKAKTATHVSVPTVHSGKDTGTASFIIRPRITEKSGLLSQSGKYTFEISDNANKASVARAIATLYKVSPINVSVINMPTKNVFVKGKKGTVSGIRKAIVTLKKGEKIDFV